MATIEYRTLGNSGLMVSTIGVGCNNFGRPKTATESQAGTDAVIGAALDAGVTLFDTADIYGGTRGLSETLMGNALKGRRDRGSRRYVRLAVESSLRRLQTDWIDLYQLHRPDPVTPIEETLAVLDDLITEGKVRYIGHSNLAGWQIADAEYRATLGGHPRFISAQNEYSLLARDVEREVLPAVNHFGLGFLPFFPLFNGLFTGKFGGGSRPADSRLVASRPEVLDGVPWEAMDAYQAFCDERGITMLAATFGWLLAQPGLSSVIAGATRPEHVAQNAEAATSWSPSAEDIETISGLFPRKYPL
jgi:aryl-alcohol dehydrogenase-like predicted oxidoreductase